MGTKDAIGFLRALTDSARAINEFRTTTKDQAKANTIRALSSEMSRLQHRVAVLEDSFVAVSEFASDIIRRFGELEQKVENVYRERLAGAAKERGA